MENTSHSATDEVLTGKRFEQLIRKAGERAEKKREYVLDRYGLGINYVSRPQKCGKCGGTEFRSQPMALPSLPDFEGSLPGGKHIIFDAKVCSQASLSITAAGDKVTTKQEEHMFRRALWGDICFLLVHFNARTLKTKHEDAFTVAFPVHPYHSFWRAFQAYEVKAIDRKSAVDYGTLVMWTVEPPARTSLPDLLPAILALFCTRYRHPMGKREEERDEV